jgi:hypothetical protein
MYHIHVSFNLVPDGLKNESTAFLFFMPITIRSLLGAFDACTASHLSCPALFCAAVNSII